MVFCGVQIWQEYSNRQKDIDAFAELSELAEIKEPDEPKKAAEPDTDGDAENPYGKTGGYKFYKGER